MTAQAGRARLTTLMARERERFAAEHYFSAAGQAIR